MAQESRLEKWAKKEAEKRGWLSFKFVSPSQRGVPDRIFIAPLSEDGWMNGEKNIVFVEFKAPKKEPTKLQQHWINTMHGFGCTVCVVSDKIGMLNIFASHEKPTGHETT